MKGGGSGIGQYLYERVLLAALHGMKRQRASGYNQGGRERACGELMMVRELGYTRQGLAT